MDSSTPALQEPQPNPNHSTFDWRVAPVILRDAQCTNPKCPTYKQQELSRLQFQTRPSYPVQVKCLECQQTWNSVNLFFRTVHPSRAESSGFLVTLGTLAGLPFMPWDATLLYGAAAALLLAQLQIVGKLLQRSKRKQAYRLFAELTSTAPLFHDAIDLDNLQKRLGRMPARFDRQLRQSLLAFTKGLQERGLPRLASLQQAILLSHKGHHRKLSKQIRSATLQPQELLHAEELLQLVEKVEEEPKRWSSLPEQAQDIVDSLYQDLVDWPQSTSTEAQEILANLQYNLREGQALLDQLV